MKCLPITTCYCRFGIPFQGSGAVLSQKRLAHADTAHTVTGDTIGSWWGGNRLNLLSQGKTGGCQRGSNPDLPDQSPACSYWVTVAVGSLQIIITFDFFFCPRTLKKKQVDFRRFKPNDELEVHKTIKKLHSFIYSTSHNIQFSKRHWIEIFTKISKLTIFSSSELIAHMTNKAKNTFK